MINRISMLNDGEGGLGPIEILLNGFANLLVQSLKGHFSVTDGLQFSSYQGVWIREINEIMMRFDERVEVSCPSVIHSKISLDRQPTKKRLIKFLKKQNASRCDGAGHTWWWWDGVVTTWGFVEWILSLSWWGFRRGWVTFRCVSFVPTVDFFELPLQFRHHQLHVIVTCLKPNRNFNTIAGGHSCDSYASQRLHPTFHLGLWTGAHVISSVVLSMKHKLEAILLRIFIARQLDCA